MNLTHTRAAPGTVTALYTEHALGLIRLAVVMLGDRAAAEDVVQDAFLGLYRRWDALPDTSTPLPYLRASVVNGCRTAMRRRSRLKLWLPDAATEDAAPELWSESAEARVLLSEEQRAVAAALRKLPRRQREALVLRYYLDLSIDEVAHAMGVAPGTVKSATHRGLAAVGRILKEQS